MKTYTGDSYSEQKLPIPSSSVDGYTFEGWCEKADLSDTPIKAIPPHTVGDKFFYAKWSKNAVSTNTEHTGGETLCEHAKFSRIYIDKSGKDQFAAELDYYYQCDSCGLYSESISGQNMIGDKNALNEWLVKWYNVHIVSCRYIDVSLDDSGNVNSAEKIIYSDYFYPVNTNDTSWGTANDDTWYVCTVDITLNNRIIILGNVHLIIRDGCTLTAKNGIRLTEGNSLSVFAQSKGAGCGSLIANGFDGNAAIGGNGGLDDSKPTSNDEKYINAENGGIFNVCGGMISATGDGSVGIGGGNGCNAGEIRIYGGDITAASGSGLVAGIDNGVSFTEDNQIVRAEGGSLTVSPQDGKLIKVMQKDTEIAGSSFTEEAEIINLLTVKSVAFAELLPVVDSFESYVVCEFVAGDYAVGLNIADTSV